MKNKWRKRLSLILLVTMALGLIQLCHEVSATAASYDFIISNGILTKYNGSEDRVSIPNGVKAIGEKAFSGCTDILQVTIPKSVTSIGRYAFDQCSGLTAITIPGSVTSIGNYAFNQCTGLKKITLSENLKSIGIKAFNECRSLTTIAIPDSVTSIGNYAFNECSGLKSVTISSNIKSIGLGAFEDCDKLTITGYQNTPIQAYADKNDISFKSLGLGSLTLDTKYYALLPRSSYTIGAYLAGSGLTLKVYSSSGTVAKVQKMSSKEYKVTGLKVGTAYINFDVYNKSNKKLAHASVKIVVKRGITPHGSHDRQVSRF